jgi:hypothetical protein
MFRVLVRYTSLRRHGPCALAVWMAVLVAASMQAAQAPPAPDPLAPIAALLGRWEGTAEGQPGKGTATREISRALNGRFIRVVHRGEYPPQDRNPKGETHEDEGFFSFDRARKRIVFRQFHVEGFVNTYVQAGEASADTIVFLSEAIENIPAGFQARETYRLLNADEFEEIFELAEPGKPFTEYSRSRFRRVK